MSLLRYVLSEVSRGYLPEADEQLYTEKLRRVSTFMKTPRELEKLMLFGFFLCLDSFLFIHTFLPLRVLIALATTTVRTLTCSRHRWLEPAQRCDIIRAAILLLCGLFMMHVDTSALYHVVRGQSVIKLYVIYNMLEIFDRLLASIGQDTLDTLYWSAVERKGRKREHVETLFYFIVANIYVLLHASVMLVQVVTLNVAINSHSKALLTIMVSNNFVEIKSSVFKKFEQKNLFQISCSDICERFQYVVLLMVISIRNLAQFNWDVAHLDSLVPIVVLVLVSEVLVDWTKHAFITKFNSITPDVYRKYRAILSRDLVASRHRNAKSDHTDTVSRKMGFMPLPLACLVWQTLSDSFSFPGLRGAILATVLCLCAMALKILLGITLLGLACSYRHTDSDEKLPESVASGQSSHATPTRGAESVSHHTEPADSAEGDKSLHEKRTNRKSKSLDDIERFTLCSNRIV